jgi:hypothetical protein
MVISYLLQILFSLCLFAINNSSTEKREMKEGLEEMLVIFDAVQKNKSFDYGERKGKKNP